MGDYFRVEVNELDRLLQQLKHGQCDLRAALNAMRDIGPKSTGSTSLDRACDDFHDSWHDAIKLISDGTAQIEDKLRETAKDYTETEQAIRDAFGKGAAA
ncbi:WXG100 family type VII secretion target [Kitasatospora sp. NPDC086801]|uniref:WXG100 family type VII secretion target n=1 Tax=Kitasatospora sp. NPDC086801 TaxID=3364066 RepID=UPI003808C955